MVQEITVHELKKLRESSATAPMLLDVREPWELKIARLSGTLDIPMNEVPNRLQALPRDLAIVVMCRSGGRSLRVANYLQQQGYTSVSNLTGGILAWSAEIDASLPQY